MHERARVRSHLLCFVLVLSSVVTALVFRCCFVAGALGLACAAIYLPKGCSLVAGPCRPTINHTCLTGVVCALIDLFDVNVQARSD